MHAFQKFINISGYRSRQKCFFLYTLTSVLYLLREKPSMSFYSLTQNHGHQYMRRKRARVREEKFLLFGNKKIFIIEKKKEKFCLQTNFSSN